MRNLKRIIAYIIFLCMILPILPVYAASDLENVLFSEGFGQFPTNSISVSSPTIEKGEYVIRREENGNKYLEFISGMDYVVIKQETGTLSGKITFSMDLGYSSINSNLGIGLFSASKTLMNVRIEKNRLYAIDNKEIGTMSPGKINNIAIEYDFDKMLYSVYLNGKLRLENWALSSIANAEGIAFEKTSAEDCSVMIDNMLVYRGGYEDMQEMQKVLASEAYNSAEEEYTGINDDCGDCTFFDSNQSGNIYGSSQPIPYYKNCSYEEKTNKIELGIWDQYNKHKKKNLYFVKTTTDDCYFQTSIRKTPGMKMNRTFNYFLIEGDLTLTNMKGAQVQMLLLRDGSTGSSKDAQLATIQSGGTLKLIDNTVLNNVYLDGKAFHCRMLVDMPNHCFNLYIDGEKKAENVSFNTEVNTVTMMRFGFMTGAGSGEMNIENFRIVGLAQPFVNDTDIKTSIFPDDAVIEAYLSDKTAFHVYGQSMYEHDNGKVSIDGEIKYDDELDELYVSQSMLKEGFDIPEAIFSEDGIEIDGKNHKFVHAPIVGDGEQMLYPVKEIATDVLGKHYLNNGCGLIIFSENALHFDMENEKIFIYRPYEAASEYMRYEVTPLQHIDNYMMFDRPKADELESRFNESTDNGAVHPRVLASADDFARIKNMVQTDDRAKEIYDNAMKKAEEYCAEDFPLIDYVFNSSYDQIDNARSFLDRMTMLGFAYQMTGDMKYPQRAWEEFCAINEFPDFNPQHILDLGEYSMASAIGYDWMYDAFTAEQRDFIAKLIYEKSISVYSDAFYGRYSYTGNGGVLEWANFKYLSNFSAVINGGGFNAAIAVAELYPDVAFDVMQNTYRSIEYLIYGLAPSGGWIEGVNYWEYAMKYLKNMLRTSDIVFGDYFNILDAYGVNGTLDWAMSNFSLLGRNNYHDDNPTSTYTSEHFTWLSKVFDRPDMMALRTYAAKNGLGTVGSVYELLDYDPQVPESDITDLPKLVTTPGVEVASMRESYTDKNGLYIGTHFGAVTAFHSHNDVGTFVFDILGERWAHDLGIQSYSLTNVQDYEKYRKRAEGHNVLVINPGESFEQLADGFAPIVKSQSKERGGYIVADISSIYADISEGKLGYYIGDDYRSLTVRNEITLTKDDNTIYWFMHTKADTYIDTEKNEAILSQNGKSIILQFETNAAQSELSVMEAVSLPTSPNPAGQDSNAEYKKVAIKMENPAGEMSLTIKLSPLGEKAASTGIMNKPIDEWTIPDGEIEAVGPVPDLSISKVFVDGVEYSYKDEYMAFAESDVPEITVETTDSSAVAEVTNAQTMEGQTIVKVFSADRSVYNVDIINFIENYSRSPKYNGVDAIPIVEITVSAQPQPENKKYNMIDGKMDTRWTTLSINENAVFDMGEVCTIDTIAAAFWKGDVRKYYFDAYISQDGENWSKVISSGSSDGLSENYNYFTFEPVKARYVKLITKGNSDESSSNVNTNILEFRIYNQGGER